MKNNINIIFISLIVLLTFELYFNSLKNDFVYDDNLIIRENNELKSFIKNFPNLFNKNYYKIASKDKIESSYRPISTLSYFIGYQIWRLNPTGYRVFNLIFHIINAILLFILANKIFKDKTNAFIIALFFISHPAITEVLNSITYNEDIFALFFMLISFLFLIEKEDLKIKNIVFISISFFFALLSKEMALAFPILILGYDFIFNSELDIKKLKKRVFDNLTFYLSIITTAILFFIISFLLMKNPEKIATRHFGSLFERIIYLPYNIFQFIKIAILPINLNADYSFSYPKNFFSFENLIPYFFIIIIIIISILMVKKSKAISFGIFWFLVTLLPVSNIIELYNPIADRYLYIPIIGFAIILTEIINYIASKIQEKNIKRQAKTTKVNKYSEINLSYTKIAFVLIIFIFYSFNTINRNRIWQNDLTLWMDTSIKSPNNPRALLNYGIKLVEIKKYDEAEKELIKVIKLAPLEYKAYFMLGNIYYIKKELKKAKEMYFQAIKIKPNLIDAYKNLAVVYAENKEYQLALETLSYVLEKDPSDNEAIRNKKIIEEMIQ